MQKGKFTNERRKQMFATTETNQPGQCITVVCLVTEQLRLSAPTKLAGILLLAALTVLSLGSRTSADMIDVGHFVVAAGGQVESVAIIVERHPDGQIWTSNTERAMQRFSPASTSKIPHTFIALEHGLATIETVFT